MCFICLLKNYFYKLFQCLLMFRDYTSVSHLKKRDFSLLAVFSGSLAPNINNIFRIILFSD